MWRVALLVVAVVAVLAVDPPVGSAANGRTYADPPGDIECCTRDITRIRVTNDDAGTITFAITAVTPDENTDQDLYIDIDADHDRSTGFAGAEFRIESDVGPSAATGALGRLDAFGNFVVLPRARVRATKRGDVYRFAVDRHALGDTDGFRFDVSIWEVAWGAAYSDVAPEPHPAEFEVKIAFGRLRPAVSASPQVGAGSRLRARLSLRVGRTATFLASGRIVCRATVAGRRLRVLGRGFTARRAYCMWRIPAWAHGRVVRGTIGVFVTRRRASYLGGRFTSRVK